MKDVQCHELLGGIALKKHAFSYFFSFSIEISVMVVYINLFLGLGISYLYITRHSFQLVIFL